MTRTGAQRRVDDPSRFGKVAVLMGGDSAEREISLLTGQAVCDGLQRSRASTLTRSTRPMISSRSCSGDDSIACWIALHGRGGEDGTVQGLLEFLGIPFRAAGYGFRDRHGQAALQAADGRSRAFYTGLRGAGTARRISPRVIESLGLPLMVKPAAEGSSIGLTRVDNRAEDLVAGLCDCGAIRLRGVRRAVDYRVPNTRCQCSMVRYCR